MAFRLLNRVRMSVLGTPGTGDITLNAQTTGFQSFSAAGAADGDTVPYVIEDGTNWEIGLGTYHSSGTLTRTTVTQSTSGTSHISATSAAIVMVAIRGQDVGSTTLAGLTDVSVPTPANGNVLTWNSTDGKWEAVAPTSGGSSGGWSNAALTSTTGSYGGSSYNVGALVTLAFGDRLEIEGYVYANTHSNNAGLGACLHTSAEGYALVAQSDGNYVPYRIENTSSQTTFGNGASGGDSIHQWDGLHYIKLTILPDSNGYNYLHGGIEEWDIGKVHDNNVYMTSEAVAILCITDDITKTSLRYRVVPKNGSAF